MLCFYNRFICGTLNSTRYSPINQAFSQESIMNSCLYYHAHVDKQRTWFFVAVLRSFEHMAFDRTLDKESSLFEIFVPHATDMMFREVMHELCLLGIVVDWQSLPNRLAVSGASL